MTPVERAMLRILHRARRHSERRFRLVTEPRVAPVRRAYLEQQASVSALREWDENMLASAWGDR